MNDQQFAKSLRLFYAFRLLATSYLYAPIFMLFQTARGLSFPEALALGGIFSGVVIAVEIPTGVFADRIGRRRSMVLGALTMIVSCTLALRAHAFGEFAIVEALAAMSIALCSGADSAYLFDFLSAQNRTHEYGRRESTASAFHLLGSALAFAGGGLLAQIDLALPYLATAGVAACAAIIATFMHDDASELPREQVPLEGGSSDEPAPLTQLLRSWGTQTIDALTDVARNPRLAWMVGYSAVVFALLRATVYLYQPYMKSRGLGVAQIGLLFAGVYVVASLVAYRTHQLRKRIGDEPLLWALLGVLAISFVGLAGAHAGPWMLALLLVQAVANGIYSPLTKPLLNAEITDSGRRAAVLSVESMVRRVAMGVFAPLVGLWGEDDVMLLCGVVGLVGLLVLWAVRSSRLTVMAVPNRLPRS